MTGKPIIFSGPMVRAILEGRKTQARLVVKPQPGWTLAQSAFKKRGGGYWLWPNCGDDVLAECPLGAVGSRLWVREKFWTIPEPSMRELRDGADTWPKPAGPQSQRFQYAADEDDTEEVRSWGWKLKPSIHMPRWASRITLEVTDVRVQRVQEISEDDSIAEGLIAQIGNGLGAGPGFKWNGIGYHGAGFTSHRGWKNERTFHVPSASGRCRCVVGGPTPAQCAFHELWDSLNGKRAPWASNPFVWAVTFKRITQESAAIAEVQL